MTPLATTMMVISMLTVWGGLALALVNLRRHPEITDTEEPPVPIEL